MSICTVEAQDVLTFSLKKWRENKFFTSSRHTDSKLKQISIAPFTLCDFLAIAIPNRNRKKIASLIYTGAITFRQQMRFLSVSIWTYQVKSHNHSIRIIYTMRFSCDCCCDSKSLRLIRTSSNFSPRFRNRKYMQFPHLHSSIFLQLRYQIARKSHNVNGVMQNGIGSMSCCLPSMRWYNDYNQRTQSMHG